MNPDFNTPTELSHPPRIAPWNSALVWLPLGALAFALGATLTPVLLNVAVGSVGSRSCGGLTGGIGTFAIYLPILGAGWGFHALLARLGSPRALSKLALVAATSAWFLGLLVVFLFA